MKSTTTTTAHFNRGLLIMNRSVRTELNIYETLKSLGLSINTELQLSDDRWSVVITDSH